VAGLYGREKRRVTSKKKNKEVGKKKKGRKERSPTVNRNTGGIFPMEKRKDEECFTEGESLTKQKVKKHRKGWGKFGGDNRGNPERKRGGSRLV